MQRHFFSLRIALAVIVAAVAYASLDLWWRGFVVVHDPAGRIDGAALDGGDGQRRALRPFAAGYWATRPAFDGHVVLFCRNGAHVRRSYATPGARTSYTVTADDCRSPGAAVERRS